MATRRGEKVAVLLGFAALLTVLWCASYVGYVASASTSTRPELAAALPGVVEAALGLSGPLALTAGAGWWAATERAPLVGARAGAARGGCAALLTAGFLLVTIPLAAYGLVLLAPPTPMHSDPALVPGPLTVVAYLLASPLGWVGIPATVAAGALYGALVHQAIGSADAWRRALPPDDVLAP